MTRSQLAVAIATVLSLCRLGATTPTAESLTDADVGAAMQAIVDELARRKAPDTYWDPPVWIKLDDGEPSQGGGYTALVALALQHAGVSYQSDLLRDVIEHLKTVPLRGTYAIATRAMVWANLPDAFRPQLDADVKWLTEAFSRKSGGWEYEARPQSAILDNSVTLFGALALWHASRRGVTIDDQVWRRLEQRFVATQNADGGWSYRPPDARSTGSMTTAGLTALHIVEDALHGPLFARVVEGYDSPSRRAQRAALAWLDSTFTTDRNPGSDMYDFYYQWGLERVALAGGRRTFGGRDWYREGAAELMRRVLDDDPDTGGYRVRATVNDIFGDSPMRNEQLAFALMFLARGRVPIVINKLQFDGAWNNRPRDVGNFTDWLGRESERELNWQVVQLGSDPTTWLNASLLYIASHEALPFIAAHERELDAYVRGSQTMLARRRAGRLPKDAAPPTRPDVPALEDLRTYLELGGMIVAASEQGGRSFARLIELMGSAMYPQYEWRDAPADHAAFSLVWPADGAPPRLRVLSNGVRDLIVLADREDLAGSFQARSMRRPSEWTTLANLVFIGSEKTRLPPRLHETNPLVAPTREQVGAGTIVRAMHDDTWKPEPLALDRFRQWFVTDPDAPGFSINDEPLSIIHEIIPAPMLVTVNGTGPHEFTPEEIEAVAAYVRAGGVILFESPGGTADFSISAEHAMEAAFGSPPMTLLSHPIITGDGVPGGVSMKSVDYRPLALETFGARETLPRLRGITVDGEPRVLFSREDLSFGWLDQPRWGIVGYATPSARALMGNIVRWAHGRRR